MPCFSSGPSPDAPEYAEWMADMESRYDSFTHVVDYYYEKGKAPLPQPAKIEDLSKNYSEWSSPSSLPADLLHPVDREKNEAVVQQILLHLDCDGVNEILLNDIANFIRNTVFFGQPDPKQFGYLWVLYSCFIAMRHNEV